MKPLNAIARRAQAMANMEVQDYYSMLVAMLARQQGIDENNGDAVLVETNDRTLKEDMKRGRDDWTKMALANLNTDGWVAVEDAKEKAVTAAEQVARVTMKDIHE